MQTIAIIGTGISGMSAGYFLRDKFDITFYEKEDYAGGHTNTLTVKEDGQDIYIDSAFMVYNEPTYPLLTRLFKELKIETKPTSMSFSVQHLPSGLEYCGTGLTAFLPSAGIFLIPAISGCFWKSTVFAKKPMKCWIILITPPGHWRNTSRAKGYSEDFLQKFLVPMSSAVWSTPADTMLEFPVQTLVRFFKNHCFLSLDGQLAWRTCVGGSRQYRDKIMAAFGDRVWIKRAAVKIKREAGKAMRHRFNRQNFDL